MSYYSSPVVGRNWDMLNIDELMMGALDGFAQHFYNVDSFLKLPFEERRKILFAVKSGLQQMIHALGKRAAA